MTNVATSKARRSKGEGTVFQNKDGRWIARITLTGMPKKEFTGKTKSEVAKRMEEYKFLVRSGEIQQNKATVAQYAHKFLFFKEQQIRRKTLKQSTYDRLEATFKNNIQTDRISTILICNLSPTDIQRLLDHMMESYSYSTIKKVYLFFQAMIDYGKSHGDLPKSFNPMAQVEMPDESAVAVETKKIEIIPEEDLEHFKEVALSRDKSGRFIYRYGPAIIFALNTGVREGELIAISKNGILTDKYNKKLIHITETVSTVVNRDPTSTKKYIQIVTPPKYPRSVRKIPLNQEAVMCLDMMLNMYGTHNVRSDYIVCTTHGQFPTRHNIQDTLDRILKTCNMKHYGTHALRHTFATRLLSRTSSHQEIKAVAEIMGDDYHVLLRTYLHTEEDSKHALVELL